MQIRVRLGAGLAPAAGSARFSVSLAENATVADLLAHLRAEYPALAAKVNTALPMVAGKHAAPADLLSEGQEVALLLPAAGGRA